MTSTYTTKERRELMPIERKWCGKFTKGNLKHKFYMPVTFRRKHHSISYIIFYVKGRKLS
jgi:hypothetical protein